MSSFDFEVAVIGGGSAGYAAARTAARAGLRTAVIEGGKEVGGLCILRGCMPTKALLYAGDVLHLTRQARTWGIQTGPVSFDFKQVMARKSVLVEEFASYRREQLSAGKFEFVRARARFLDPHTVALDSGKRLTAAHFILTTGSVVTPPPWPQLEQIGYLTSDDALSLEEPPRSLIVLGGGAVAVEFAQFFARFDIQVTLIQRSEQLLREFDPDLAGELSKVFRREGIQLYSGTRLTDAWREGNQKGVTFEHQGKLHRASADHIFLALGRSADTSSLGLEQAGVKTEHGRVIANERMQTSVPHIYAAGDCTGPHEIVHIAIQQGETAAHNIACPQQPRAMDYRLLTTVIFTEPQIASVGLSETEAKKRKIPYLTASYPFADHGKAIIMEARDGFVKLLADPQSGEILGGSCIGPHGGELIHEIIAAMHSRMTVRDLMMMPHYHPTLAEIWTYPAEELAEKIFHLDEPCGRPAQTPPRPK